MYSDKCCFCWCLQFITHNPATTFTIFLSWCSAFHSFSLASTITGDVPITRTSLHPIHRHTSTAIRMCIECTAREGHTAWHNVAGYAENHRLGHQPTKVSFTFKGTFWYYITQNFNYLWDNYWTRKFYSKNFPFHFWNKFISVRKYFSQQSCFQSTLFNNFLARGSL